MEERRKCFICGDEAIEFATGPDAISLDCNECGVYTFVKKGIRNTINSMKFQYKGPFYEGYEDDLYLVKGYIKNHHYREESRTAPAIPYDKEEFANLMSHLYQYEDIKRKIDLFLLYVKKHSKYYGHKLKLSYQYHYPLFYTRNHIEFQMIVEDLNKDGYISKYSDSDTINIDGKNYSAFEFKLDRGGYNYLEEKNPESKQIFVAMKFKKKGKIELPKIYEKIYDQVKDQTGFELFWMGTGETKTHTNKICDEIIAQIRKSRLVIADVTHSNQNMMFEAGYAKGINLEVLWACEEEAFKAMNTKNELPFDIRQYHHERWKIDDLDEYSKSIISFIEARF